MGRSGRAECHFRRDFSVIVADALAVFFQKLGELRLRDAEMGCAK
jgi:hypothetical protein